MIWDADENVPQSAQSEGASANVESSLQVNVSLMVLGDRLGCKDIDEAED
jgi:hypothetical protein